MAGIYIHIPFCKQACHYCDFHFSTNLKKQDEMIDACCKEVVQRRTYLTDPIETIYFGGGTPSLLTSGQLESLLGVIYENFNIPIHAEITLEANPEDLYKEKVNAFKHIGVNRLSIGIQTFHDAKLTWMNRIHNVNQVMKGYENARAAGFDNISLDLIYALPDSTAQDWQNDLQKAVGLDPEHISLYDLTIERKTVFGKREEKGKLIQVSEDEVAHQYLFAIEYLIRKGYVQYEVSNFGKPGYHSRHNSSYWTDVQYMGIGPGAHSFNGKSRRINIANNAQYMKHVKDGTPYSEMEILSKTQLLNEYILTGLRTVKGLNLDKVKTIFGVDLTLTHSALLHELSAQRLITMENACVRLKSKGFLIADEIAVRMFSSE